MAAPLSLISIINGRPRLNRPPVQQVPWARLGRRTMRAIQRLWRRMHWWDGGLEWARDAPPVLAALEGAPWSATTKRTVRVALATALEQTPGLKDAAAPYRGPRRVR
jgi:hypothetical protein